MRAKIRTHQRTQTNSYPFRALKGLALEWFMSLQPYNIDSFSMLTMTFTTQFDSSRRHDLTSLSLLNLKQEERESLRILGCFMASNTLNMTSSSYTLTFNLPLSTLMMTLVVFIKGLPRMRGTSESTRK